MVAVKLLQSVQRGRWLRWEAELKGFPNASALSRATGISRQTLERFYEGAPIKQRKHQQKLATVLDVEVRTLTDGPWRVLTPVPATTPRSAPRAGTGDAEERTMIAQQVAAAISEVLQNQELDSLHRPLILAGLLSEIANYLQFRGVSQESLEALRAYSRKLLDLGGANGS